MPAESFKYRRPNATEYLIYNDFCLRHQIDTDSFPFHKKFTDEFGKCTGYAEVVKYEWHGNTVIGTCSIAIAVKFTPANIIRTWLLFTDRQGHWNREWTELQMRDGKSWTLK